MKIFRFLLIFAALAGFAGEASGQISSIQQAASWGYQLQNAAPGELAASGYDVIVMDYSRDGTGAGAYAAGEIQSIKNQGKIVLAYLSIGEAEDYRFYWRASWQPGNPPAVYGKPIWLGPANPEWPGNYKVLYWYTGWWTTALKPYLDRILAAGFDGVYLDIIDAYWHWYEHAPGTYTLRASANRMVKLVEKIGAYTRGQRPGFILCPQNGESIIDDASADYRRRYLQAIDALGVEDLFYYCTKADQKYRLQLLQKYANQGKKIFNIEYIAKYRWTEYLSKVCAAVVPVIPYAGRADRNLDELIPDFPKADCGQASSPGFSLPGE
ncbi:MAG: hypothetical protein C4567_11290 [Deltaproteobacteria bacterium]|nr:MAG: hypothetical protein C4567_11290 [Deltaproteobacteria bacterium]